MNVFYNHSYLTILPSQTVSVKEHIITYNERVLQSLSPGHPAIPDSLGERTHNKTLISKTTNLNDYDLVIRMLYKDLY